MKKEFVSRLANEFIKDFHKFVNSTETDLTLPDMAITGTKKCGTYALLEFLIAHPKIQGSIYKTKEFTFIDTGRFELDFAAFVRSLKFKINPKEEPNRKKLVKIVGFNILQERYFQYKEKINKSK